MKRTLLGFLLLFTSIFYSQVTSISICDSESFNLTTLKTDFIGSLNPAETTVTYFLSEADALNNTNVITNPTTYKGAAGTVKIYGRIDNNGTITSNYFNLTTFPAISVTASNLPIPCIGATTTLTVNASGGNGSYTYSINGSAFSFNNRFTNLNSGIYNIEVKSEGTVCQTAKLTYIITEPSALLTTYRLDQQNVIIDGFGGTPPYQYSLDGINYQSGNFFTNLAPGTYNIRMKDAAGCIAAVTAAVPPILSLTAFVTKQLDCSGNGNNGIITANASGGQGPYRYSIDGFVYQTSNVFNNLNAGTYVVTVKDALNSVSNPFTVTIEPLVNVTGAALVTNATSCTNASIVVYASSGQAPYLYSMDNGQTFTNRNVFNNLTPSNYVFLIKDSNGCVSSPLFNTVQAAPPPLMANIAATPISCWGEKATLTVAATGGQSPYQYSINNSSYNTNNTFTNLTAGNYIIKVMDAVGCVTSVPYIITEPSMVSANLVIDGNTISMLDVQGGTGSYFYALDNGSFQTNNVFTNLTPGLHTILLRDAIGCESKSFNVTIENSNVLTAVTTLNKDIDCMSNAVVTVNASGGTAPYTYSINGASFQTTNIFSNLTEGTYSITVKDANGAQTINHLTILPLSYPVISVTNTNVSCNHATDGTISVNAAGGKAPYTYSVNNYGFVSTNVFTNLVAGFYNVTVKDANGCLSSIYAVVTEPSAVYTIVNTEDSTTSDDNDGLISVIATGGTAPYFYALTDSNGLPAVSFQSGNIFGGLKSGSYTVWVKDANGCIGTKTDISINKTAALSATVDIMQVTCNNSFGTITVSASGGKAPYIYSLNNEPYQTNNVFNALNPGNYIVTVKDADNLSYSNSAVILPVAALTANAVLTKTIDCISNGIITVSATGGQGGPYLYSFDNGNTYVSNNTFSNAVAGMYSIMVKDSYGCISNTQVITVDPLVPLAATAAITKEVDCSNGSFRVDVSGGKSPYLYSINNEPFTAGTPLFNKPAGTYIIQVKDAANCIAAASITLKPYTAVTAAATVTNVTCSGASNGAIRVVANGGFPPYYYSLNGTSYQSNSVFGNMPAGTYTIRIRDDRKCISTVSAVITQPTSLAVISTIKNVTCRGSNNGSVTLTVSGGRSPYSYSKDGTTYLSNPNFTSLTAGTYTFYVRDANGCILSKNMVVTEPSTLVQLITDIKTLNNDEQIGAYIKLNATGGTAPYVYSLKNENTGIVYAQNSTIKTYSGMAAGLYTISVTDANGCMSTKSNVDITLANPIILNAVKTYPTCVNNYGSLSVNLSGGVIPYYYSTNGGTTYTTTNTGMTNLPLGVHSLLVKDAIGNEGQTHIIVKAYAPPKITTAVSYETSNGYTSGMITVNTTGGTAPYSYTLKGTDATRIILENHTSTIYSGLPADTYTIFSKDANGCESEKTAVTLTIPEPILINASISAPLTCSNSTTTLTFSASGGTGPYLYSANGGRGYTSTGIYTVEAGTYSLHVKDALGNTSWISYVVKPYSALDNTFIKRNISCSGSQDGSVQFIASGGIAPYTYSLDQINYSSNASFSNLKAGTYNGTVKDAAGCSRTFQITLTQPAPLAITNTVTNSATVESRDGKIMVNASGGTAPYLYSLKNENGIPLTSPQSYTIFQGLPVGKYTIEAKDANGCIAVTTGITITSATLFGSLAITPASCVYSGSITVNAAGGKYPLQYSFDNGTTYTASNVASNLIPGTYIIKVRDAEGAILTLNGIVETPTPLIATISISSVVKCNGGNDGAIRVTASLGKAPYLYSLNGSAYQSSNIFSNLAAGNYFVNVKDGNECSSTMVVNISEPAVLTSAVTIKDNAVTVNAAGGTGNYVYAISTNLNAYSPVNTFTNLEAGTYTVRTRDANGCFTIVEFNINPPAPSSEGKNEIVMDFQSGQTLADLTIDGQDIKWYSTPSSSAGKTIKINEAPLPLTTVLVDGTTYYASQTINGIESRERLAVTVKLNGSLAAQDFNLSSFQFYPNPVKDIVSIQNDSIIDSVEIIAVSGKLVLFRNINELHSEIDLSHLSSGVYIMKVKSENKQKTIKFIKK